MSEVMVSAALVSELRRETGAGMMDCKQALMESGGDKEKAIEYLRKKGKAAAEKRADRTANEGVVVVTRSVDGTAAALVEVNSETDFVARNDEFRKFAEDVSAFVLGWTAADTKSLDELKTQVLPNGRTIGDSLTDLVGKIGEKLDVGRFARLHVPGGYIGSYVHGDSKLGTIVALTGLSEKSPVALQLGKDLAMQVAAASPAVVRREQLDPVKLESEMAIEMDRAKSEGKPEAALKKIAEGRVNKWVAEVTLLEQPFIKDPKVVVKSLLEDATKSTGAPVDVAKFVRIRIGE